MKWTKKLPTKPGLYWGYMDKWVQLIKVEPCEDCGEGHILGVDCYNNTHELPEMGVEWWSSKPIEVPDPPKPKR